MREEVADITYFVVSRHVGGTERKYIERMDERKFNDIQDSLVFHAGTTIKDGKVVSSGGRVMAVTSFGNTIEEALEKSYRSINKIHFDKMNYRKDIGFDLV